MLVKAEQSGLMQAESLKEKKPTQPLSSINCETEVKNSMYSSEVIS